MNLESKSREREGGGSCALRGREKRVLAGVLCVAEEF